MTYSSLGICRLKGCSGADVISCVLCAALSVVSCRLLAHVSQLFRLNYCAEQFAETANISFQCCGTLGKMVRIDSQNNQSLIQLERSGS